MNLLHIFLIQKKYKKTEKELIINDYKEGIEINLYFICNAYGDMKNNKLNGKYLSLYKNGQIWIKCYYKNNKLNGEYLQWYKNVQLREKSYYKNDKRNGKYLLWYENGQLWEKHYYKNNRLNSEYQEWCENGQYKKKILYKIIKSKR